MGFGKPIYGKNSQRRVSSNYGTILAMEPGLLALLGLFVGAIVNVLIDRLQPYDYVDGVPSGARPRSLAGWEYLPFASLVGARRSQRVPHRAFSVRYPLVELGTAFLFGFA